MNDTTRQVIDHIGACCEAWAPVGAWRRGEQTATLDLLVVPKREPGKASDDFFATQIVNKVAEMVESLVKQKLLLVFKTGYRIKDTALTLVIHECKASTFATRLVFLTGPKNYLYEVHTAAKALGYQWIPDSGFRPVGARVAERSFVAPKTEVELFNFLKLPYTDPKLRKLGTLFKANASTDQALTHAEFGEWVKSSKWANSTHAGEPHQWTLRVIAESDDMFLRVINQIHGFGYAGFYKGQEYRYLDFGDYFYFTQGYTLDVTKLINRKPRSGTENRPARPWVVNPIKLRLTSTKYK